MSQFYAFTGHQKDISRIVATMFSGTSAGVTFVDTPADLAPAGIGDSFLVCSTNEPSRDLPGGMYDAMRAKGMAVWHISESWTIHAKQAAEDADAAKNEAAGIATAAGPSPVAAAAAGMVSDAALAEQAAGTATKGVDAPKRKAAAGARSIPDHRDDVANSRLPADLQARTQEGDDLQAGLDRDRE